MFDESIFPFENLHPNVGARLRKDILLLPGHLLNPDNEGVDCTDLHDANDHNLFPDSNTQNFPEILCCKIRLGLLGHKRTMAHQIWSRDPREIRRPDHALDPRKMHLQHLVTSASHRVEGQ